MNFKEKIKKHQNTIFGIAMILIIIVGLIWIAGPAPASPTDSHEEQNGGSGETGTSTLSVDMLSYDCGTISMAAGKVTHPFKVKNTGDKPVAIVKMYTSCMCTEATLINGETRKGPFGMPGHGIIPRINESIAPDEEATIDVVYDPAAHGPAGVGRISRAITIETSEGAPLQLQISVNVTP